MKFLNNTRSSSRGVFRPTYILNSEWHLSCFHRETDIIAFRGQQLLVGFRNAEGFVHRACFVRLDVLESSLSLVNFCVQQDRLLSLKCNRSRANRLFALTGLSGCLSAYEPGMSRTRRSLRETFDLGSMFAIITVCPSTV